MAPVSKKREPTQWRHADADKRAEHRITENLDTGDSEKCEREWATKNERGMAHEERVEPE
jgi:hypothetical protein